MTLILKRILGIFLVGSLTFIVVFSGVYQCPIKWLTGISCLGCGMSRAYIELVKGNVSLAFTYHPLFLIPIVWVIIYCFRNKLSHRSYNLILWFMVILFIVTYIYRIMTHDPILTFDVKEGVIYKLVHFAVKGE